VTQPHVTVAKTHTHTHTHTFARTHTHIYVYNTYYMLGFGSVHVCLCWQL